MDSPAPIPRLCFDEGLESVEPIAEQDSSSSWLDLIDWTSLDPDFWVNGESGSTSNEATTNGFHFQEFDGQLFEAETIDTTLQYHPTSPRENPDQNVPNTKSGLSDSPQPLLEIGISEDDRLEDVPRPGRGRKQIHLSGARRDPCPSPSRRKGPLSDLVRKGMEELKHAKGACWRCKILRKKVSPESEMNPANSRTS